MLLHESLFLYMNDNTGVTAGMTVTRFVYVNVSLLQENPMLCIIGLRI